MTCHREDKGGALGKGLVGTGFGKPMTVERGFRGKKVENGFKLNSEHQRRRDSRCAGKRKRRGQPRGAGEKAVPASPTQCRGRGCSPSGGSQQVET